MKEFKSGDVIKLIAGGYPMTVSLSDAHSHTTGCYWFDCNGELRTGSFKSDALELTTDRLVYSGVPHIYTVIKALTAES